MKSEYNGAVARVLRGLKGEQKLPVRVLVERTGIPTATMNRLLNNERDIKMSNLALLADCFNVSLVEIFERVERDKT